MFTAKDTSKKYLLLYCVLYPSTTTVQVDASADCKSAAKDSTELHSSPVLFLLSVISAYGIH